MRESETWRVLSEHAAREDVMLSCAGTGCVVLYCAATQLHRPAPPHSTRLICRAGGQAGWLVSLLGVSQGQYQGVSWAAFSSGAGGPLPAHSGCWQNPGWMVYLLTGSRNLSQFLEAILKFSTAAPPFTRAAGELPSLTIPLTLCISDFWTHIYKAHMIRSGEPIISLF